MKVLFDVFLAFLDLNLLGAKVSGSWRNAFTYRLEDYDALSHDANKINKIYNLYNLTINYDYSIIYYIIVYSYKRILSSLIGNFLVEILLLYPYWNRIRRIRHLLNVTFAYINLCQFIHWTEVLLCFCLFVFNKKASNRIFIKNASIYLKSNYWQFFADSNEVCDHFPSRI